MTGHRVDVGPLPPWLDHQRLLGPGDWVLDPSTGRRQATLARDQAADVDARLRGLTLAGHAVTCTVTPRLSRPTVRHARLVDARRRRDTTPGFTHPAARLDEEGRWSLTPEALALTLGRQAVAWLGADATVLDLTAGAGGSAIGFARAGLIVTAVERDAGRLALARHNAAVYGVADRVRFVCGDARDHADDEAKLVFVDPPWGGLDRARDVVTVADLPLLGALAPRLAGRAWWAKLPPAFDETTLPPATWQAWFGEAPGDRQRIKFLLAAWPERR